MFTQSNLPSLAAKVDRWKLSQDLIGTYAVLVFERLPLSSVICQPLLTKTTFHWFPRLSLKTLSKPHVSLLTMSCWHDKMFLSCWCFGLRSFACLLSLVTVLVSFVLAKAGFHWLSRLKLDTSAPALFFSASGIITFVNICPCLRSPVPCQFHVG